MSKFACMLHGLSHAPLPELAVHQSTVYIPSHTRLTVHHLLLYVIRPDGLTHITSLENEPCETAWTHLCQDSVTNELLGRSFNYQPPKQPLLGSHFLQLFMMRGNIFCWRMGVVENRGDEASRVREHVSVCCPHFRAGMPIGRHQPLWFS